MVSVHTCSNINNIDWKLKCILPEHKLVKVSNFVLTFDKVTCLHIFFHFHIDKLLRTEKGHTFTHLVSIIPQGTWTTSIEITEKDVELCCVTNCFNGQLIYCK